MRVRSVVSVPIQSELTARLLLPDGRSLRLNGVVVWSEGPDLEAVRSGEFGLEFTEVNPEFLSVLAGYFAEA